MGSLELSNLEIADLCRELALLLHSGFTAGDGLYLMAEEEKEPRLQGLLSELAASMDQGSYLHQAFAQAGCFPVYMTGLLRVGEDVGRTEETLNALALYYENRERMQRQIVTWPPAPGPPPARAWLRPAQGVPAARAPAKADPRSLLCHFALEKSVPPGGPLIPVAHN